jgi:uncharacterized protein YaiE (UPF0345 family)
MSQHPLTIPLQQTNQNILMNGDFLISQRGKSFVFPSLGTYSEGYTLDRWVYASHPDGGSSPAAVVTQEAFSLGQTDVPGNPSNFLRITYTTIGASLGVNSYVLVQQIIPHAETLFSQVCTISFYARSSIPQENILLRIHSYQTDANEIREVVVQFCKINPDNNNKWQRFKTVFKVPGKSVINVEGSEKLLFVQFLTQVGSNFTSNFQNIPRVELLQTGTIDIADFKMELGNVATPMERKPYLTQLWDCQEYFYQTSGYHYSAGINNNVNGSGYAVGNIYFPRRMRYSPSVKTSANFQTYIHIPGVYAGLMNFSYVAKVTDRFCLITFVSPATISSVAEFILDQDRYGHYVQFSADT